MQTFTKNEKVANYRLQSLLFSKGHSFYCFPFRVQWLSMPRKDQHMWLPSKSKCGKNTVFNYPAKCMFAVSKRYIKSAVKRNRVKRLSREAYRKNKSGFYAFLKAEELLVMVAFVYTAKEVMPYDKFEAAICEALQRLQEKMCSCG